MTLRVDLEENGYSTELEEYSDLEEAVETLGEKGYQLKNDEPDEQIIQVANSVTTVVLAYDNEGLKNIFTSVPEINHTEVNKQDARDSTEVVNAAHYLIHQTEDYQTEEDLTMAEFDLRETDEDPSKIVEETLDHVETLTDVKRALN